MASDSLWNFLRQRGVSEENLAKIQEDKIDISILSEIDDDSLARYIPAYGDRVAARRFCLEKQKPKKDASRMSLLEKLQKKMKTASATCGEPSQPKREPSKNAIKSCRKIELGWIHEGKQVRKRSGGGTRVVSVPKTATKDVIMKLAKDLFFPNNESTFGIWEDFVHDIHDFKETPVDAGNSVGDLYILHKFGILRFYLNTRIASHCNTDVDFEASSSESNGAQQTEKNNNDDKQSHALKSYVDLTKEVPFFTDDSDVEQEDNRADPAEMFLRENEHIEEQSNVCEEPVTLDLTNECANDSEVIIGGAGNNASLSVELDDTIPVLSAEANNPLLSSTIIQGEQPLSDVQLSKSAPVNPTLPNSVLLITIVIEVHRMNIVSDLINRFKDEVVMNYTLKYRFAGEKGNDADGVARDIYAAFWSEFMNCAAEGVDMRVPSLTTKWQEEEWNAIGRILAKGYIDQGYFPIRLAPAFTTALVFGEHAVSTDVLFTSLMAYLSKCDRNVITEVLNKEDMESDDKDELIDLMDRLGITTLPTPNNLKALLLQAAHKLFIQNPKYALDNMSSVSRSWLRSKIKTIEDIKILYEEKRPTNKKVLKLITADPANPAEQQSLRFIQQYIREIDETGLRNLLRFITGSDIIVVDEIKIMFTLLELFTRRPVAHTCGAVLELPATYNSFPELRVELDNLLNSHYLAMDII